MKNKSQNKQNHVTILVIESNKTHQFLLEEILKRKGTYSLIFASNQEDVIYWINSNTVFDLMIIEPRMPKVNGYVLIKYLKQKRKHTPLIALTVCAMCNEKRKCLDNGCDAYISKPFIPSRLIRILELQLEKALQEHKKLQQLA